jgi:hypothetical protein
LRNRGGKRKRATGRIENGERRIEKTRRYVFSVLSFQFSVLSSMTLTWDELEQIRGKQEWRIPIPPTCPCCGYNLTGLPSNRCPECGLVFNWKIVRRRAGQVWSAVNSLRNANRDAVGGLKIVGLGWLFMIPVAFLGLGVLGCVLRVIIASAAILALVLGSQVLSIRRVPKWARVYIEGPPTKVAVGAAAIVLSLVLLAVVTLIWR